MPSRADRRRLASSQPVRAQPGPETRDATVTDTDALLGEAGYSAAEIAAMREEGIAA